MRKRIDSLQDIRKKNYLFILPGVFIATVAILFIQFGKSEYNLKFYAQLAFIFAFIVGWTLAYTNNRLKVFEYFMLFLVYTYHFITITIELVESINSGKNQDLGTFIIWLPLIIIYTFTVLKRRQAAWASIVLLILTMAPGIYFYFALSPEVSASLTTTYLTTAVYSIILLFAYQLVRTEIEVQVMRRQLLLDPLTQIGNRYQVDRWMNKLIKKADDEVFSVLFLDLDYFKAINDEYGHKSGDDVLKELTEVLQENIEKEHDLGRWGGEEFIILMKVPECEAFNIAEKLRVIIEGHKFEGIQKNITISIGVTEFREGDTTDSILIRADERLYISKDEGRNRVTGRPRVEGESL